MYEAWEAVGKRIEDLGGRIIKGESAHLEIGDVLTEAVPISGECGLPQVPTLLSQPNLFALAH